MTIRRFRLPVLPKRKWIPGHYISMGDGSARRETYWKVSGGANLLTLPGVKGIHIRFKWNQLETSPGVFNYGPIKATYADTERSVRAELWRCAQNNSQLVLMPEDRTFDGTTPAPSDMAGNTDYVRWVATGTGGGYTMCRWNPTVVARWRALIQNIGLTFNSHPNFYGIAFQETAQGFTATDRQETGYTDLKYRDAIIGNIKTASDAFADRQVFWFTNFFPTKDTDYRLQEAADVFKDHNNGNHGINMGGPDVLPDKAELITRVYPRFGAPPVGSWGELKLSNSMQNDSYEHVHATASTDANPDPVLPNDRWAIGDYWTMDQLFRWGLAKLHYETVFWNFDQGGVGNHFIPEAAAVIAANPSWTVPPP